MFRTTEYLSLTKWFYTGFHRLTIKQPSLAINNRLQSRKKSSIVLCDKLYLLGTALSAVFYPRIPRIFKERAV